MPIKSRKFKKRNLRKTRWGGASRNRSPSRSRGVSLNRPPPGQHEYVITKIPEIPLGITFTVDFIQSYAGRIYIKNKRVENYITKVELFRTEDDTTPKIYVEGHQSAGRGIKILTTKDNLYHHINITFNGPYELEWGDNRHTPHTFNGLPSNEVVEI